MTWCAGRAPPSSATVEGRVQLLAEFAEELVRMTDDPAAMLIGGALINFFTNGKKAGDLVKYLQLSTPRGSHSGLRAIYRRLKSSHRR